MLGKKNKALAAMELADDEIELVSGGYTLPDGWQEVKLKCRYCPAFFPYIKMGSPHDELAKQEAEFNRMQHEDEDHGRPKVKEAAQLF